MMTQSHGIEGGTTDEAFRSSVFCLTIDFQDLLHAQDPIKH